MDDTLIKTYTLRISNNPISYGVGLMTDIDPEYIIWYFGNVTTAKRSQTEQITFNHANSTNEFKR